MPDTNGGCNGNGGDDKDDDNNGNVLLVRAGVSPFWAWRWAVFISGLVSFSAIVVFLSVARIIKDNALPAVHVFFANASPPAFSANSASILILFMLFE